VMLRFNVNSLPGRTKNMHKTQSLWRKRNWQRTLKEHHSEIETSLNLIEFFDYWNTKLTHDEVTKTLSKEIYSDSYLSIHFACFGLYKYAHMSLRSEFETALRLIYFSNHPLEFAWWQSGNEKWTRDLLKGSDVWGQDFKYFNHIPEIISFESNCPQNKRLLGGNEPQLKKIYSILSKHVHSVAPYLQTRHGSLSPKYIQSEFDTWAIIFKDVQRYVNILLVLGFPDKFKSMNTVVQNRILDEAIGSDYKTAVKNACGI